MEYSKDTERVPSLHSKSEIQADEPYKQDVENQSGVDNSSADNASKEEAPRDANIVDWDGPDDPVNPMNWSSSKKFGAIGIVSLVTMLS